MSATENGGQVTPPRQSKSVLLHNEAADIVLLDIPTSIAEARGLQYSIDRQLVSSPALEKPFPSHEPKSAEAQANLDLQSGRSTEFPYQSFVEDGLSEIKSNHDGDWCLARAIPTVQNSSSGKRKLQDKDVANQRKGMSDSQDVTQLLHDMVYEASAQPLLKIRWCDGDHEQTAADMHIDDGGLFLTNSTDEERRLEIESEGGLSHLFFVPPLSSSLVGDCSKSSVFYSKIKAASEQHGTKRSFDLIMMDPPWPNKSIRRGHEKGRAHYSVSDSLWDLRQLIFDMDIDVLLADKGYIGVWITNNAAVRDLVVGDDGFFESWGVKLVEEWIWVKVTRSGEPVMSLASCWRKPYEVLLLGEKVDRASLADVPLYPQNASEVKRRLIAAVPDLHSRKPCLKSLLEPLMPRSNDYRALEIFARNLVSGWWSWGNEAIKFNHESCWVTRTGNEDDTKIVT